MKALVTDGFFQIKLPPAAGVKKLLRNYLSSAETNMPFMAAEI